MSWRVAFSGFMAALIAVLGKITFPASVPVVNFLPAATKPTSAEVDALARTIYGEARGDGATGMQAVANVIVNRMKKRGQTVTQVIYAPWQFSLWNVKNGLIKPGSAGYAGEKANQDFVLSVTSKDPLFAQALQIAQRALDGTLADITGGSDHYYSKRISPPDWASTATVTAQIGSHLFFNLG